MVKGQIVPDAERSSESCLHCEINDLVQEYIEGQERVDIVELAAKMAESLVELVLLALEEEQAKLLAGQEAAWLISGRCDGPWSMVRCAPMTSPISISWCGGASACGTLPGSVNRL
jgi:hypothetical protein